MVPPTSRGTQFFTSGSSRGVLLPMDPSRGLFFLPTPRGAPFTPNLPQLEIPLQPRPSPPSPVTLQAQSTAPQRWALQFRPSPPPPVPLQAQPTTAPQRWPSRPTDRPTPSSPNRLPPAPQSTPSSSTGTLAKRLPSGPSRAPTPRGVSGSEWQAVPK